MKLVGPNDEVAEMQDDRIIDYAGEGGEGIITDTKDNTFIEPIISTEAIYPAFAQAVPEPTIKPQRKQRKDAGVPRGSYKAKEEAAGRYFAENMELRQKIAQKEEETRQPTAPEGRPPVRSGIRGNIAFARPTIFPPATEERKEMEENWKRAQPASGLFSQTSRF